MFGICNFTNHWFVVNFEYKKGSLVIYVIGGGKHQPRSAASLRLMVSCKLTTTIQHFFIFGTLRTTGGYENYGKNIQTDHANSFRDFNGNTYFIGDNKSWKSSNSPLIFIPKTGNPSFEQTSGLITKERNYYVVQNSASKETYIITESSNEILIYSVQKKKIVRTIPEKEGKIRTIVSPAKEGHLMIVETNRKERYTRLSIELLD